MIENYENDNVRQLLDGLAMPSDEQWVWDVIAEMRRRYPEADHWTTGGGRSGYVDVRVGKRWPHRTTATAVIFQIIGVARRPTCKIVGWLAREAGLDTPPVMSAATHPTSDDITTWLDEQEAVISPQREKGLSGQHNLPTAYSSKSLVESKPAATATDDTTGEEGASPGRTIQALNRILYGPPGTGKTYATIDEALSILDPEFLANQQIPENSPHDVRSVSRAALKSRFDELTVQGRIRFVTFHQSFSYEDFVEGLRATTDGPDGGALSYRVEPGVFRQLCTEATRDAGGEEALGIRSDARIWKISIDGTTSPSATREQCFRRGEARVGWKEVGDLTTIDLEDETLELSGTNRHTLFSFSNVAQPGDLVLCIRSATSVAAIGVVTGSYRWDPTPPSGIREDYCNVLPTRWIATGLDLDVRDLNADKIFVQKTFYELSAMDRNALLARIQGTADVSASGHRSSPDLRPFVLIIDEINRGNVSRIFGELITLIEPSKRAGEPEALSVRLPYSKAVFSVPSNVYLIGTMNTADRSLAGMDVALRRRFSFKEMPPRPDLLRGTVVESIRLDDLLRCINDRIEVLLGRDHLIGHAYFIPMTLPGGNTLANLAEVFRKQILPLLQEYFFEDWERIAWVLNDHRKKAADRLVRRPSVPEGALDALFGKEVAEKLRDDRWRITSDEVINEASYAGIVSAGS